MLQREHSAILLTFIKLPVVIRPLLCLFLSGRFTQVLLYIVVQTSVDPDQLASIIWAYTVLKTGYIQIQHGYIAILRNKTPQMYIEDLL